SARVESGSGLHRPAIGPLGGSARRQVEPHWEHHQVGRAHRQIGRALLAVGVAADRGGNGGREQERAERRSQAHGPSNFKALWRDPTHASVTSALEFLWQPCTGSSAFGPTGTCVGTAVSAS